MKAIVLYGHACAVVTTYEVLDALLRRRMRTAGIVVMVTDNVHQPLAVHMRERGAELWHCRSTHLPLDNEQLQATADRYVRFDMREPLQPQVERLMHEFLEAREVTA
ncbi:MAG: hypothetical protein K0R58_23 [Ramlibacter sp.]|nr:hypothetical protein [Ramlibacter sp.]